MVAAKRSSSNLPGYCQVASHGLDRYWVFWITTQPTRESMLTNNIISLKQLKRAGFNVKQFSSSEEAEAYQNRKKKLDNPIIVLTDEILAP